MTPANGQRHTRRGPAPLAWGGPREFGTALGRPLLTRTQRVAQSFLPPPAPLQLDVIGDSYMAADGFSHQNHPNHARRMLRFAVDLVHCAQSLKFPDSEDCVQVRVGLCTGPVAAGVLGKFRRKYTVMGSTVNLAR